jgi:sugar phosphate isomerase/epimerase
MRTYSLDQLSLVGVELAELVEIAAAAGFDAVTPFAMSTSRAEPMTPLRKGSKTREMASRLRETGIRIVNADGFALHRGHDITAFKAGADLMAELGASNIVIIQADDEEARGFDGFCELAEHAATLGLGVALEFMPTSQVRTLDDAVAFISRAGMSHVGMQVDVFHVMNGGGSISGLSRIEPALIRGAQISDGMLGLSFEEYARTMITHRLPPGEGEFPLAQFLAALPAPINVGVEVPRAPAPQSTQERQAYALRLRASLDAVLPEVSAARTAVGTTAR